LLDAPQWPSEPSQGNHLLFFRFVQDVAHIDEGYRALRRFQRPRASFSLAGFQVTFIGRFWVTAEADGSTEQLIQNQLLVRGIGVQRIKVRKQRGDVVQLVRTLP